LRVRAIPRVLADGEDWPLVRLGAMGGDELLRLDLGGTRIFIHSSDLSADSLEELAAGLVRAPSEPPAFSASPRAAQD
jgi:hypothetical protein